MRGRKRSLLTVVLTVLLVFVFFLNNTAPVNAASKVAYSKKKQAAVLTLKKTKKPYQIYLGAAYELKCSLKNSKWTSSKAKILKVDAAKNVVYAVGVGTAMLTAKAGTKKITAKVMVLPASYLSNFNGKSVDGGADPAIFNVCDDYGTIHIHNIITYHYNDGDGEKPGTISIYNYNPETGKRGKKIATYKAIGLYRNTYWNVTCNLTLQTGSYMIVDSDSDTWSQNKASGGVGFVGIYGSK